MKIVVIATFVALIAGVVLVSLVKNIDDAAMAQCQKTHSYDVCFQELNR